MMKTIAVATNILRVVITDQDSVNAPSYMVKEQPPFGGACTIQAATQNGKTAFVSGGKTLFTLNDHTLERFEMKQLSRSMDEAQVMVRKTVDGEKAFVEGAKMESCGEAYKARVRFGISPDEAIYGLGQQEDGNYNHRGKLEYLYQNNMMIPMPVYLSTAGYAVFFDAGCLMRYEEQEGEITMTLNAVDQIDFYIIQGECFDELVAGIRRLTGKNTMLPKWAVGYVQSRERYVTQEEILQTARRFKEDDIPLGCLVLDWCSWEDGKWGNKIVDKSRFPDLKAMVDELHGMGIAFMVSVWPNAAKGCENHLEFKQNGQLLANQNTYDAFDEQARKVYWNQLEAELHAAGVDAWWCDSTEPFTPDWGGPDKLSDERRYQLSAEALEHYLDARHANSFALMHAKGVYENQRAAGDFRRVVNLTRSGSPSGQRYGAILWSGDTAATWQCLKNQIAEGLNMCMSGYAYWTFDIGAFFTAQKEQWFWRGDFPQGNQDPAFRELYTRWLQMGAFLPIMRSHGTDTEREPWFFGKPGEKYYDAILKYIRLRYRLAPYSYSLMGAVVQNDDTMLRSLLFDFAQDKAVYEIADQFLYGRAFMACPVTEPMEHAPGGKTITGSAYTRRVYLPKGADWYDYATMQRFGGGQWIDASAPIETMPLFVKAGSIVPVSLDGTGDVQAIEVYPGADADFTLYLDNGADYAYENGEFVTIPLHWNEQAQCLTAGPAQGKYPYPDQLEAILRTPAGDRTQVLTLDAQATQAQF